MQSQKIDMSYLTKTFGSPRGHKILSNIPMEFEYAVRKVLQDEGLRKIRFRYRGPRTTGWFTKDNKTVYFRNKATAKFTCLKQDAEKFSVYYI